MQQHKKTERPAQRNDRENDSGRTGEEAKGVSEKELTEEVNCCLADIDEVLAETGAEEEKAEREFRTAACILPT